MDKSIITDIYCLLFNVLMFTNYTCRNQW